jgi:hypothetical protein
MVRLRVACKFAARIYGQLCGVDVAFGDPSLSESGIAVAADALAFAGIAPPRLRIYPIATHVAEKLHACSMPRARPNLRVQDLPDLAAGRAPYAALAPADQLVWLALDGVTKARAAFFDSVRAESLNWTWEPATWAFRRLWLATRERARTPETQGYTATNTQVESGEAQRDTRARAPSCCAHASPTDARSRLSRYKQRVTPRC